MTPKVLILATCRKPELAPMTELVFKTLRVGFPTAKVTVFINGDSEKHCPNIKQVAELAGCEVVGWQETIHHLWIEDLIAGQHDPFWIVDTDMVFFNAVEDWRFDTSIAGSYTPEWQDNVGNVTRSRLHTSLMYIDPVKVRQEIGGFLEPSPLTPFMPPVNPFYPLLLPFHERRYFYDTCSFLYHLIGGTKFTDAHKDAYFHFNMGTISDLVMPLLDNPEAMRAFRDRIVADPQRGRGQWRECDKYYADRPARYDGISVIAPVKPQEAASALEWNFEVCKGNEEAMSFGDLWYGYVHGIDDLVDTMRDGRPTMSKERMISLFFCACLLYNHPYYMRNQRFLYPIILETTNLYKLSVGWENSPKPHLRAIADVLRSCGLKMHTMIALLCGGEAHMIDIARRMYEEDYLRQHGERGQPI